MRLTNLLKLLLLLFLAMPVSASEDGSGYDSSSDDEYDHPGGYGYGGPGGEAVDDGEDWVQAHAIQDLVDAGVLAVVNGERLEVAPGHAIDEVPEGLRFIIGQPLGGEEDDDEEAAEEMGAAVAQLLGAGHNVHIVVADDEEGDEPEIFMPSGHADVGEVGVFRIERARRTDTGAYFLAKVAALQAWAEATPGVSLSLKADHDHAAPPPCFGKFDDEPGADDAARELNERRRQRFKFHVLNGDFDKAVAVLREADPGAMATAEGLEATFFAAEAVGPDEQGYVSFRGIHHLLEVVVPAGVELPEAVVHNPAAPEGGE